LNKNINRNNTINGIKDCFNILKSKVKIDSETNCFIKKKLMKILTNKVRIFETGKPR
jgi:hypothetical protein